MRRGVFGNDFSVQQALDTARKVAADVRRQSRRFKCPKYYESGAFSRLRGESVHVASKKNRFCAIFIP